MWQGDYRVICRELCQSYSLFGLILVALLGLRLGWCSKTGPVPACANLVFTAEEHFRFIKQSASRLRGIQPFGLPFDNITSLIGQGVNHDGCLMSAIISIRLGGACTVTFDQLSFP
jgi:hypothetical protein